ncbi:hypothetical protein [Halosegnis longus]
MARKQDDDHAEWSSLDEANEEIYQRNDLALGGGGDEQAEKDDPPADAEAEPAEAGSSESDPTRADGGRRPPEAGEDPAPARQVPDHYVTIEEFLAGVEEELPDGMTETDEWAAFRSDLLDGPDEYVDERASDIEAGEVETAA